MRYREYKDARFAGSFITITTQAASGEGPHPDHRRSRGASLRRSSLSLRKWPLRSSQRHGERQTENINGRSTQITNVLHILPIHPTHTQVVVSRPAAQQFRLAPNPGIER